ncbi:MAG: hypothetical protein ABR566_17695 [Pyrinomonadaceae bacterium]
MQAQKTELFEQLSAQGWSFAEVEDWQLEWWADEIWLLESTWSPVGSRAYLTFLVDPMVEDWQHRNKGESVWAAQVSPSKPESRTSPPDSFVISLNQGWQKELPALLKHLSLLREKNKAA